MFFFGPGVLGLTFWGHVYCKAGYVCFYPRVLGLILGGRHVYCKQSMFVSMQECWGCCYGVMCIVRRGMFVCFYPRVLRLMLGGHVYCKAEYVCFCPGVLGLM